MKKQTYEKKDDYKESQKADMQNSYIYSIKGLKKDLLAFIHSTKMSTK